MTKQTLCTAILMVHSGMMMHGQSHVAEPSVNLGDSSFLDGIGGLGFLTEQMNDFEHDGRITSFIWLRWGNFLRFVSRLSNGPWPVSRLPSTEP
jgi:hypothetical protein